MRYRRHCCLRCSRAHLERLNAALGLIEGIADGERRRRAPGGGARSPTTPTPPLARRSAATRDRGALVADRRVHDRVWQVGAFARPLVVRADSASARNALLADVVPAGRTGAPTGRARDGQPRRDRRPAPRDCARRDRRRRTTICSRASSPASSRRSRSSTRSARRPAPDPADRKPIRLRIQARSYTESSVSSSSGRRVRVGNVAATLLILRATDILDLDLAPPPSARGRPLHPLQRRRHARQHPRRTAR